MSCKAEEKAKPLLQQHKTAALLNAFSPEPWRRVAEGGESPYFKYLSNTCEAVQLVKRLFLSQEPIMKAGGSSYACWEKQGTGTAERPWKMMRMKTRFHRVMGGSKLELPFSFRTWGGVGGTYLKGRMKIRQSSVALKSPQVLRLEHRFPMQFSPSPYTPLWPANLLSHQPTGRLGKAYQPGEETQNGVKSWWC